MSNKYTFTTKSQTLKFLATKLTTAKVLPILSINATEYFGDKSKKIEKIQTYFNDTELLIIRSSAKNEDTINSSNAGKYESILNVNRSDTKALRKAIERVFQSYGNHEGEEEVLIQPMLENIKISGVAFTCDINTLSPYYVINYDESNKSDSVTGGLTNKLETYVAFKESPIKAKKDFLNKIISCCKELEYIFSYSYLDIEFGVNDEDELYIFQVRPVVRENKKDLSTIDIKDSLRKMYKKIQKLSVPHPNLLGKKTIFGVMPDWNPAEIIGLRPKKLAISLYKELIMDSTWAYQRDNYGYRNLRSHPLMVSFLGVPYIDVRVSFNSFIPKTLHEDIAKKLMNFYLDKLAKTPVYHDKVEFEIVHSCYYLNLGDNLKELLETGFTENEVKRIEFALLEMTNKIINPQNGLYRKDIEKIKTLEEKYERVLQSDLAIVDKIYWLIEDCKRYGTLPFAGVARCAFIAIQFLKSFVSLNIMTKEEYESFMNSLNTINKKMNNDLNKVATGELTEKKFLEVYGHIRPGTYDILSLRYDEDFEGYFDFRYADQYEEKFFSFTEKQLGMIEDALIENGINIGAQELIKFIKESIEGREYTKYVFTKSLSKILQLIEEFGKKYRVFKEDLAFLDIQRVKELYSTLDHRDVKDIFMTDIQKNKDFYRYTEAIKLPSIIINPEDVYQFFLLEEEPNFITLKKIKEKTVKELEIKNNDLRNKIVFIKSADPGYDFLFSKKIGGLVTQFGGANSHMAIRCAELGIPAVIGAGEQNFIEWSRAEALEIDCSNKQVRCIV